MEVSLTEDIQPALGATDMEDNDAAPNLAGLAGDGDSDDDNLMEFSIFKVCSQSTRGSNSNVNAPDTAEGEGGGPGTPQPVQGEPTAEEGNQDVEAEAEEQPVLQAMDAAGSDDDESEDDEYGDYVCPVVEKLAELKWTRWATDMRPCRLLNKGDYATRVIPTPDRGHVHVELFPLKSETSLNNTVMVREDKLRAFNESVEGDALIWSPALKADMLRTKTQKKRKASITVSKTKTSVPELQAAMNFAEECLKKSIEAIEEKEEKRRREELQEEEELAAMGVQAPMDIEEPQEEAKEEGDEASTETATEERSRFRDKSFVKLRPGDIVKYKRDGAHMTEPAESMVRAVKPSNMRSKDATLAGCLVQLQDESWLGPKDTLVKIKRAKPHRRHEDVPVKDQRFMKVEDHHLVPGPLAGWNMADIETKQQAVAKIVAEGVSNIEELFQQHICNKKPRKSKAPAQEEAKPAEEEAEEGSEEQAEGEAAGSAGESKPRGRSKTPLGGQKANTD